MGNILTFAQIAEAPDITEKEVPIPEWGGSVVVRSISYVDMQKIKGREEGDVSSEEIEKAIIMHGLVNPKIEDEHQYEVLISKSASAVMTILKEIMGTSKAEEKSLKGAEKSVPVLPE